MCYAFFVLLGFNEADTIKSSSILIYWHTEQSIYTKWNEVMPKINKKGRCKLIFFGERLKILGSGFSSTACKLKTPQITLTLNLALNFI